MRYSTAFLAGLAMLVGGWLAKSLHTQTAEAALAASAAHAGTTQQAQQTQHAKRAPKQRITIGQTQLALTKTHDFTLRLALVEEKLLRLEETNAQRTAMLATQRAVREQSVSATPPATTNVPDLQALHSALVQTAKIEHEDRNWRMASEVDDLALEAQVSAQWQQLNYDVNAALGPDAVGSFETHAVQCKTDICELHFNTAGVPGALIAHLARSAFPKMQMADLTLDNNEASLRVFR